MTLVDVDTGEIVERHHLAVPRPTEVANVHDLCARIEAQLAVVDDVEEINDAKKKFAAIDTYLAQTTKDGRARLAATMRRLEARIGKLIGDALPNGGVTRNGSVATDPLPLSKDERTEFRLMAAHPEVVEAVISESDDNAPASRRKVVGAIRTHLKSKKMEDAVNTASVGRAEQVRTLVQLGLTSEQIAEELDLNPEHIVRIGRDAGFVVPSRARQQLDQRVAKAREMAASGHTSKQIAASIGINAESMSEFRKRHGIDVPADKVVGRTRAFDSARIVREAVLAVSGIDSLFDQIDYADLDPKEASGWVDVLDESLGSLKTLRNRLKEIAQP